MFDPNSSPTMKAIRISTAGQRIQYSSTNPAPSSALEERDDIALPRKPSRPGEVLVRVRATTIIRDNLTWPELYAESPCQLGNDFSGIVIAVHEDDDTFKPGDEVYGMVAAERGGTWAEYVLVDREEIYLKPDNLTCEEAAALPLSALTADQALFEHAALGLRDGASRRVLITGASGGVGTFLVQFARLAGHHVVAATSSNARNEKFLKSLSVQQVVEYSDFSSLDSFDAVIDTGGGQTLELCWTVLKDEGSLISVDSASWNFVEEHAKQGISQAKAGIRARFFIVKPSRSSLERISKLAGTGDLRIFVAESFPLSQVREAYDLAHSRHVGRGKIVLLL